jgi:hypothetical protein
MALCSTSTLSPKDLTMSLRRFLSLTTLLALLLVLSVPSLASANHAPGHQDVDDCGKQNENSRCNRENPPPAEDPDTGGSNDNTGGDGDNTGGDNESTDTGNENTETGGNDNTGGGHTDTDTSNDNNNTGGGNDNTDTGGGNESTETGGNENTGGESTRDDTRNRTGSPAPAVNDPDAPVGTPAPAPEDDGDQSTEDDEAGIPDEDEAGESTDDIQGGTPEDETDTSSEVVERPVGEDRTPAVDEREQGGTDEGPSVREGTIPTGVTRGTPAPTTARTVQAGGQDQGTPVGAASTTSAVPAEEAADDPTTEQDEPATDDDADATEELVAAADDVDEASVMSSTFTRSDAGTAAETEDGTGFLPIALGALGAAALATTVVVRRRVIGA